ncbi:DUF3369 domain-containing protein [Azospirillum sp.]|uniref:hybrid sensor histidine kinase/response regulator n=1 Tax=Azospirillum sp. TaxID=34012 RepID=UPI002D3802AE|nr:DUF3369 domain-containing protein [Azospirillum sp.]HYD70363.1 DUF3369 domain-containing protein [Azospirillum sp.]
MSMAVDEPLFREDEDELPPPAFAEPWPVLVVDDDPQVHTMTTVLLRDFEFEGRPFEVVSALSGAEARAVLASRPDIPVALLDVVMETDDAGLRLVRHIREDLGNGRMRIILRTGQPGQAPERDVVVAYDINDYKSKNELTAQKLFTALVSALRAWRDIVTIERHRQGLERILNATSPLLQMRSMRALVDGLVDQLPRVIDNAHGSVLACRDSDRADLPRQLWVIAGTGRFAHLAGVAGAEGLPADIHAAVMEAFETQRSGFGPQRCVLAFRTLEHGTTVFVLERPEPYTEDDHRLLDVFCSRVAIGFDNVCLYEDMLAFSQSLERRVAERTAELEASQQALIAAKRRVETALEREMEAKHNQNQFLGMVSHEFRTPLAVIDSAAQLMALRAERVDPEMLDRLAVVRSSVHRLTGLIDAYLTDERLQSGTLVLERREVDLAALLETTLKSFRIAYPGHGFVVELGGLPPRIAADAHLLGLVFTNLIGNAVKYSADTTPHVTVRGGRDGSMVVVEVADRGRGIPEGEIPRLFERFFRGVGAAGVPGTGIGLHTVQQIVQLHQGAITVDSVVGEGSTFRVVLPATAGDKGWGNR